MRSRVLTSRRVVGMTLLFLCVSFPVYPQMIRGISVYGRVFLPDSQPAIRVTVNISGQNGFSASTVTDGRGGFRFDGIPRSIFTIKVSPPENTKSYAEPLTIDATTEGTSFMADVFLRDPMEPSSKKKKSAQVVSAKEAGQQIPKDARKAFERSQKYREEKKYAAALEELDKAIRIYPDYFQALSEKGVVLINSDRLPDALQAFYKAIEIFPEYEPALSGAGYCLLSLGKYEEAITFLEKAVSRDSNHTQNLMFLGIANLALSHWQRAQEVLEQALKVDAAAAVSAHTYLADAFAGQHHYTRAADEIRTYLQLHPDAPNAERLRQREKYFRAQKEQ